MSIGVIISFVTTCFLIELTPGPNMAYLAILSLGEGRRAGFAATAGVALGLLIVGLAVSLGVSAVMTQSPAAYQSLRWFGALYLLWLAWDGWRSDNETSAGKVAGAHSDALFFRRGLITNLLNPKAALFYIGILPDFVHPVAPAITQSVMLTVTYVTVATAVHSIIVMLSGSARAFLEDPARNRLARRVLSALLACVALWFLWSTGRGTR
jgi:threonine/homoserine/homoserine lactone efflux protein